MRSTDRHSPSERILFERLSAGDPLAAGELFDRIGGALFALALRITNDPAAAEDTVEEAFVEMCKAPRMPGVEPLTEVFARCRALALERGGARPTAAPDRSHDRSVEPSAAVRALGAEARREVAQTALATLAGPRRVAIERAYFDGWSVERIATESRRPAAEVASEITRGLVSLAHRARAAVRSDA